MNRTVLDVRNVLVLYVESEILCECEAGSIVDQLFTPH